MPGPNGSRDNGAKSGDRAAKKVPKRAAAKKRKNASKAARKKYVPTKALSRIFGAPAVAAATSAAPQPRALTAKEKLERKLGPDDGVRRGGSPFLQGGSPGLGCRR